MNQIFAIRKDLPNYQVLDLGLTDITRHLPDSADLDSVFDFSELNTSLASLWNTPETRYVNSGKKKALQPDLSCWVDSTLVLSPKAYRFLKDSLVNLGEFLPVEIDGELHYIFNCFVWGDVNEEACEFNNEEGMEAGLKHLEFRSSASNLLVFKAQIECGLTLFCSQRFKDIVESFELVGLTFDENLIVA
ncbi:MAG: hypothetical protein AAGC78_06485 [Cellvibrio sp.]|uniref:hypothetical protein n=1 Tax=Cellvibrio sp. TaxID=1965322 RepID=UPI0031B11D98